MNNLFDEIEVECLVCDLTFITYIHINGGNISEHFCSSKCLEEYYSVKNTRDRKINIILKYEI